MRRRHALLVLLGMAALATLLVAGIGLGFSDGVAGSSGQYDARFWGKCPSGIQYCKVDLAYCGDCHGSYDEMWRQEGADRSPQEKVGATLTLNGAADAWEYNPGQNYLLDLKLADGRPKGAYSSGGFDLNASAGRLDLWTPTDPNVRITGGTYAHAGSKNPDRKCGDAPCGASTVEEGDHAGEATQTAVGSERRDWRIKWTAPGVQEPHGVALVLTAMLPNGDGGNNCTHFECDEDQPVAPQSGWDWYSFMIPRKILCERGHFDSRQTCEKTVLPKLVPPNPPPGTPCPSNNPDCHAATASSGRRSPAVDTGLAVGAVVLAAWALRRR